MSDLSDLSDLNPPYARAPAAAPYYIYFFFFFLIGEIEKGNSANMDHRIRNIKQSR